MRRFLRSVRLIERLLVAPAPESAASRPAPARVRGGVSYAFFVTLILLLIQSAILWKFNGRPLETWLSDVVQLLIGIGCVVEFLGAFRRSRGIEMHFCGWLAATFAIWVAAQALGLYIDATATHLLDPLDSLLFFLSGIPFGMLLFLDSNADHNRFDRLHVLDFLQVCAFWVCVYLYFSKGPDLGLTNTGWGRFGWSTSLVFNGVLALSFVLRAVVTDSRKIRAFFLQMALYLLLAGIADSYVSFAPNNVKSGSWFDMVWSGLLCGPLLIAASWGETKPASAVPNMRGQRIVVNQFFPLVYPFFSLLLIAQMAGKEQLLSSVICAVIFAAVGIRVLIIQHRLVAAQEKLQFDATHDALTGLSNRKAILECLERELERQQRTGSSVGVIMADADFFKKINDLYGHAVGDEVLKEISRRMIAALRGYDWVGRYGGEEFLIILPGCDGKSAFASAERLRRSVADLPVTTHAGSISVTVSMGLIAATGGADGVHCSMLLRMVDEALYRAKANGRNRIEAAYLWGREPTITPRGAAADFSQRRP